MLACLSETGRLFGLLQLAEDTMIKITGPFSIFRGDSATYLLQVTDDEGNAFDITAAAIELEVAQQLGGTPVIAKAVGTGITISTQSGATLGQATIAIAPGDTNGPTTPPGLYYLDVVVTLAGNRQHVVAPLEWTIAGVVSAT